MFLPHLVKSHHHTHIIRIPWPPYLLCRVRAALEPHNGSDYLCCYVNLLYHIYSHPLIIVPTPYSFHCVTIPRL